MVTETLSVVECRDGELSYIKISGVDRFDVSKVFDCGQCFRFDRVVSSKHQNEFAGCAYGKYISVAQDQDILYIYNVTMLEFSEIFESFLALDEDYGVIEREILSHSAHPTLRDALEVSSGIRILKQEPWEAICSFIISQNNNIPRIKKLVASLCRECGEKVDFSHMGDHIAESHLENEGNFYTFPSPRAVLRLGIDRLVAIKTGFRAKYIFGAAEKMACGEIDMHLLKTAPTAEAINHLCSVKGIGPKVASCALLFGFARLDAFPIDVWIKKVIAKYFEDDFEPSDLGYYAGVAQQYLFYYERYLINDKGENKK